MPGLLDDLNTAAGNAMTSPLFNMGMGLIAGTQPFANPGREMQQAAANQQSLAMNRMQMQMLQQQWPLMMKAFAGLGSLMGPPQKSASKDSKVPKQQSAPVVGPFSAIPPQSVPQAPPVGPQTAPSSGLDPTALERFGLMTSAFPMTKGMSDAALKVAGMQAQYDPALQTRLAIAKSVLTQDQQMMADAQASGDTLGFKAAQMKYLKDSGLVT